jgi:hypothetical protein
MHASWFRPFRAGKSREYIECRSPEWVERWRRRRPSLREAVTHAGQGARVLLRCGDKGGEVGGAGDQDRERLGDIKDRKMWEPLVRGSMKEGEKE